MERFGAAAVFMLIGINAYHAYFFRHRQNLFALQYLPPCGLLALCAMSGERPRTGCALSAVGGFLLAAGGGYAAFSGCGAASSGVYLLVSDRRCWSRWVLFGVGGLAGLALCLRRALSGAEGAAFRFAGISCAAFGGRRRAGVVYKVGFLSRMVQGYYLPVLLCWSGVCRLGVSRKTAARLPVGTGLLWSAGIAVTLAHLAAPFPYDEYQVMVMPVLTVAAVCSLTRWLGGKSVADGRLPIAGVGAAGGGLRFFRRVVAGAAGLGHCRTRPHLVADEGSSGCVETA
jgi:hypothetical protein